MKSRATIQLACLIGLILFVGLCLVLIVTRVPKGRSSTGPLDATSTQAENVLESAAVLASPEPRVVATRTNEPPETQETSPRIDQSFIRGQVVDGLGVPLRNVAIMAIAQSERVATPLFLESRSDSIGQFQIDGCEPSTTYQVKAELEGWWQDSRIVCSPGPGSVEVVLHQGGGIRGVVIPIAGSAYSDYIVVGRNELPIAPVAVSSEELKDRITSMMREEVAHQLRDQRARLLFEHLNNDKQVRPGGDAWARLDANGRFVLKGLRSGRVSVAIAECGQGQGFVTVQRIAVYPGQVNEDAMLNPLDLNAHACRYEVVASDLSGVRIDCSKIDIEIGVIGGPISLTAALSEGSATFFGPLLIDKVEFTAAGYKPTTLHLPPRRMDVSFQLE